MKLEHSNQMVLLQKQMLSSQQIQSLELLSLNNADLDALMQNEYLENPLLDNRGSSTGSVKNNEYQAWCQTAADEETELSDFIWDQINHIKYSKEELRIFEIMIGCLDESGFLTVLPEEIQQTAKVPMEQVLHCLDQLKQLEPVGIFSADLSECLLCQLDALHIDDPVLQCIIEEHLEELSQGKISAITRALNISSSAVRKYQAFIHTLNPRPIAALRQGKADYVIPDIIVSNGPDGYEVTINDNWLGEYHMNDYYADMLSKTQDPELIAYFKDKKQRVNFLMEAIEKRRNTIISIVTGYVKLQGGVLERKENLRPVTMKQLAAELGISTSTVSRAVKDKYMQYPFGNIAMRDMFASSVGDSDDQLMSVNRVKAMLAELIAAEDKRNPYSDSALVEMLAAGDVRLSRRGVAKYRDELGIAGSFDRKIRD